MDGAIPVNLQGIYREVLNAQAVTAGREALMPIWKSHVRTAQERLPELHVEADGAIMYLGALSPGCRACREGTWDCIFVTMRCNLECPFCLRPQNSSDTPPNSVLGASPEEIGAAHAKTRITGVSFSGGEALLRLPELLEWIADFKRRFPHYYYWVYTNGLLADAAVLRRLGDAGIDEVRFNMAATGYVHPTVMRNLAAAGRTLRAVTVECPAIPAHAERLLSALAEWCEAGVSFLNLHELIYEVGTNSGSYSGTRVGVVTADGHRCEIDPESRALTLAVMEKVTKEHLPLSVNDCSFHGKLWQMQGRRRCIAPLVQLPHEKIVRGEILETYGAWRGEEVRFIHPDFLREAQLRYRDHQFVRLERIVPLSPTERSRWIVFERL